MIVYTRCEVTCKQKKKYLKTNKELNTFVNTKIIHPVKALANK